MKTAYQSIGTFISCLTLSLLPALPALAHDTSAPLDAASQHFSDIVVAAVAVCFLSVAAYYGLGAAAAYYERRRHLSLDETSVKAGRLLATGGAILLLWRLAAPVAVASTGAHRDMPQHGGQIQSVGDNHLEAAFAPDGGVTLYVMGIAETIPFPLPVMMLRAKAQGTSAEAAVLLQAAPLSRERNGQASVFSGRVPAALARQPILLTVSVPLSGQTRQVQFDLDPTGAASAAAPAHDTAATLVVAMPVTPEERSLFLKPGGAYTSADIAANGGLTPEQKFQGIMANHHLNPKKGTYTCPITKTQANPKFAWVVGGNKYLFCCPPCVTEFVKQAKTDPQSIQSPMSYIQQ